MSKMAAYSSSVQKLGIINEKLGATIIANALMWASAIAYLQVMMGPLEFLTVSVFLSFFVVSNIILYSTAIYARS
ncbi:MAG: hypothetical protein BAJATHORv1_10553 [Candidatus Thorarchaeota archaeon]|nr:MAG: hypothetical protein BAJATHORv1_10553 [Candidatus Thorarchaeota archaeon]